MVMELILRPYVTAGVVVAGAGLIAAAPIGPTALEIQTRAVQLASVDALANLTGDQDFPIASWTDAYNDTVSNVQDLEKLISGDPTPILSQIDANFTTYAEEITTGLQNSSTNLTNALQDLGPLLTNVLSDLQSGDVYDAETSLYQFLLSTPLDVSRPVISAFFEVVQSMVNNLDNVLTANGAIMADPTADAVSIFAVPEWFTDLREAPLFGPNAAEYAMAGVIQDIINAYQAGDTTLALNDLSNSLSTIVDAYFNGYQIGGGPVPELVSDAIGFRGGLDPTEGALNGGVESVRRAEEIVAGDLGGAGLRAFDASASTDWNTLVGDIGTWLNPDTALGEIATAFDPNAVADLTSLLSGDLAPNASTWVVDMFSGF
jgi:hypothetical protein